MNVCGECANESDLLLRDLSGVNCDENAMFRDLSGVNCDDEL